MKMNLYDGYFIVFLRILGIYGGGGRVDGVITINHEHFMLQSFFRVRDDFQRPKHLGNSAFLENMVFFIPTFPIFRSCTLNSLNPRKKPPPLVAPSAVPEPTFLPCTYCTISAPNPSGHLPFSLPNVAVSPASDITSNPGISRSE